MRTQDKQLAEDQQAQDNSLSSAAAKAERLKRVRNLANLSREDFCSDGTVNLTTLISWEVGRFGGLSRKGAASVTARVAKEGVFVTPEWLLYGTGNSPDVHVNFNNLSVPEAGINYEMDTSSEDARINVELMVFRKLNKNVIDFIVDDDAMLPHYRQGDYVAGTKRFNESIESLVGYDCIVQTADGRILMRNLQAGPRNISFNLVSTNLQSKVKNAISYDVELASAAPIVWHRRKEPVL